MKRCWFTLLIGSLLLTLTPVANAAVRAGSGCLKLGQTSILAGKKFTCIKSGKKLVWNKGVAYKNQPATPKTTPALPNIIFPLHNVGIGICDVQSGVRQELHAESNYVNTKESSLTLWQKYSVTKPTSWDDIDRAVVKSFADYVAIKKKKVPEFRISMEPGITDVEMMSTLYRQLVAVAELLGSGVDYPDFRKPISIVVFKDPTWLTDEYVSMGCDPVIAKQNSAFASSVPGSASPATLEVHLNLGSPGFSANGTFSADLGGLGGHEFFHLIQGQNTFLINNIDVNPPGWLGEGGASLVGALVSNQLKIAPFDVRSAARTLSSFLEGRTLNLETSDGTSYIYLLGLLGCEFLVSTVGFERFVNIWKEAGKGKRFPDAFQDATGIELKDFYKMFYEVRPIFGLQRG